MKGVSVARRASVDGLPAAAYARGMTLSAVGRALGVDPSVVVLWSKHQRPLPLYHVEPLGALLDVTRDELETLVTFSGPRRRYVYTRPPGRPPGVANHAPPVLVAAPKVHAERAGECLAGDHCPRWRCKRCGRFWLGGVDEHRCARAAA